MNDSQVFILADHYENRYEVTHAQVDVVDVLKRHVKEKTIHLKFCQHAGRIDRKNEEKNKKQKTFKC